MKSESEAEKDFCFGKDSEQNSMKEMERKVEEWKPFEMEKAQKQWDSHLLLGLKELVFLW
jgi:hypothetical protein